MALVFVNHVFLIVKKENNNIISEHFENYLNLLLLNILHVIHAK